MVGNQIAIGNDDNDKSDLFAPINIFKLSPIDFSKFVAQKIEDNKQLK